MNRKPIRRSKELVHLSRDHHDGLLLCWKIRTGLNNNIHPNRISAYVSNFFETELKPHFAFEEKYVFTLLPDSDKQKTITLQQHAKILADIASLKSYHAPAELLASIADDLEAHIRFEERQLFGHIETNAEACALANVGYKLEKVRAFHSKHNWNDEFWKNKKASNVL